MKDERLIDSDYHLEMLEKKRKGKLKQGLGIDILDFDNHIRLKKNEFTVVSGHANVGKTTVVLWIMLVYSVKHGTKWLIYSSENNAWSLIDKLISMKLMDKIDNVQDLDYYHARDFVMAHFKFINDKKAYSAYELLEVAESILIEEVFDGFLIDPYNSLSKDKKKLGGISVHDYDYEVATAFRLFCKNKNVCIFLNAHGVSEAMRKFHSKDDEYMGYSLEGHPRPLAMADLEGGAKWAARCDNMWCVHRYTRHEQLYNLSLIHVNKVKETESGGAPTFYNEPIRLDMNAGNVFKVSGMYNPLDDKTFETQQVMSNIDSIF